MATHGLQSASQRESQTLPASAAELTSERFVRGVALALRAQWEGIDQFQAGKFLAGVELDSDWTEFRADSEVAIQAYLDILERNGFRIVREAS